MTSCIQKISSSLHNRLEVELLLALNLVGPTCHYVHCLSDGNPGLMELATLMRNFPFKNVICSMGSARVRGCPCLESDPTSPSPLSTATPTTAAVPFITLRGRSSRLMLELKLHDLWCVVRAQFFTEDELALPRHVRALLGLDLLGSGHLATIYRNDI